MFCCDLTGNTDVEITPAIRLDSSEPALSSFGKVPLICAIEDRFEIEIPSAKIRSFRTVRDGIRFPEKNPDGSGPGTGKLDFRPHLRRRAGVRCGLFFIKFK